MRYVRKKETEKFPISVGYLSCKEARYNRKTYISYILLVIVLWVGRIQGVSAKGNDPKKNPQFFQVPPPSSITRDYNYRTPSKMFQDPKALPEDQECPSNESNLSESLPNKKRWLPRISYSDKIMTVTGNNGQEFNIEEDQARDKFRHAVELKDKGIVKIDVTENFSRPEVKKIMQSPDDSKRKDYCRKVENLPNKSVKQYQEFVAEILRDKNTTFHEGTLGAQKIKGIIAINEEREVVGFFDKERNRFRTLLPMSKPKINQVIKSGYHLFSN